MFNTKEISIARTLLLELRDEISNLENSVYISGRIFINLKKVESLITSKLDNLTQHK